MLTKGSVKLYLRSVRLRLDPARPAPYVKLDDAGQRLSER
jgi:hypothetical protein